MDVWRYLGESPPPLVRIFNPLPEMRLKRHKSALIIVDMDPAFASEDQGIVAIAKRKGIELAYFRRRLPGVISNIARLQSAFRESRLKLVYTTGRAGGEDRIGGFLVRPLMKELTSSASGIVPELAPRDNDIEIEKSTPGPFGVTLIDHALKVNGIETVVVTGLTTDQCVEATVRGAFDFGYQVILVEDATISVTPELHESALRVMADWFCRVWTTDEVLIQLSLFASRMVNGLRV